jgi:predicted nucleic acid-binding Zn ribbon protein
MLDNCRRCGKDINQLRPRKDRRWCSDKCAIYWKREQRRAEARLKRPRCVICDNAIQYGKTGIKLTTKTCSKPCGAKYSNWFVRASTRKGRLAKKRS